MTKPTENGCSNLTAGWALKNPARPAAVSRSRCFMKKAVLLIWLLGAVACNLQVGTPTPFPTPDLPRVEFQAPANNDSFVEGTDLTIALVASDDGPGIARIELMVDDLPHSEVTPEVSEAVPVFTVTMNWL